MSIMNEPPDELAHNAISPEGERRLFKKLELKGIEGWSEAS